ncbi:MAG: hypothetical protein ABR881_23555 [Candidatus Sulfotelmatobacter sp.]
MDSYADANLDRLSADVHFLVSPLRYLVRSLIWLAVLILAPAIFFSILIFVVFYNGADKSDAVWALKWVFGVLSPFASAFWFLMAVMVPKFYRAKRDGYEIENNLALHIEAIGAMLFAFVTTGAAMFWVADALQQSTDVVWFAGAYLAFLCPFLLLAVWRLLF